MKPDEHLRHALRHAPDAALEAPAALSAHILARARAATAPVQAQSRKRGSSLLSLAPRGTLFGLAAVLGVAALWGLSGGRGPGEPALQDLPVVRMAQAPAPAPAAQAAAPTAPPADATPAPLPAQPARARRPVDPTPEPTTPTPRAEASALPPPPAAFQASPPPVAAPLPVPVAVAAAPAAKPVASSADAAVALNPVREWLLVMNEQAPAQQAWLQALADATEGQWGKSPLLPSPAAFASVPRGAERREHAKLAAALAPQDEGWELQAGGRSAGLRLQRDGVLWCEAIGPATLRCQFAPLDPVALKTLRDSRPSDNPRP